MNLFEAGARSLEITAHRWALSFVAALSFVMCGGAAASQAGLPDDPGTANAQAIHIAESQTEERDAEVAGEADSGADESDVFTESYECEDGKAFRVRFDNSWTYSIAVLILDDQPETPLIQAPSGSGVIYSNGDYTLHTKADTALLMRNDTVLRCTAK